MGSNFDKINYLYSSDKLKKVDFRSYGERALDYAKDLAKEANAENEKFVRNNIKAIEKLGHNYFITRKLVSDLEKRLGKIIKDKRRKGQSDLPPSTIFKEDVRLGSLAKRPEQSAALGFRELNKDTFLFGKKGEGKTNLILLIIPQIVKKQKFCLMFDFKMEPEYRDLIQIPECSNMAILPPWLDKDNIFDSQGDPQEEWLLWVWEILRQSYNITEPSQLMLISYCRQLSERSGIFCMHDLRDLLEDELSNPATPQSDKNKIHTCLKIIKVILLDAGPMLDCRQGYSLKDIYKNFDLASYELNKLSSKGKQWIPKLKLKRLHQLTSSLGNKQGLNIAVVTDEAKMMLGKHIFQSAHMDYIKEVHTQSRGAMGMGWIIADQSYSSELADFVLENIETQICFRLTSPAQIRNAAFSMGCDASEIRELHTPFALMRKSNWPRPFKIQIEKVRISKSITDGEVRRSMNQRLAKLNYIPRQGREQKRAKLISRANINQNLVGVRKITLIPAKIKKNPLEDLERFLRFIKDNPSTKLTDIYKTLHFSGRKGDTVKNNAKDNLLIEEKIFHTGRKGRPLIELELTVRGKEYINEK